MLTKLLLIAVVLSPLIWTQIFSQISPCNFRSREFEPNPRGCSWYWRCRDNETNLLSNPVEEMCDFDAHFNYNDQSCGDFDERCSYDDEIFESTPTKCPPFKQDFVPHILYCDEYFLCWQGRSQRRNCDEGEHFSYFQNGCTNTFLADCRTEHNYCRRMREDNVTALRSPFSCTDYHVCNECNHRLSLIELQCVNTTTTQMQFDNKYQQCDTFDNVRCNPPSSGGGGGGWSPPGGGGGGGNGTTGSPGEPFQFPPEPHSIQCTIDDVKNEFVMHPVSCFFFFNCASGRSTLYSCPKGSHFDVDKGQCWHHEEGFKCSDLDATTPGSTTVEMTTLSTESTTTV